MGLAVGLAVVVLGKVVMVEVRNGGTITAMAIGTDTVTVTATLMSKGVLLRGEGLGVSQCRRRRRH
jgi:hypothetical protein